jgi:hypothetical protein
MHASSPAITVCAFRSKKGAVTGISGAVRVGVKEEFLNKMEERTFSL